MKTLLKIVFITLISLLVVLNYCNNNYQFWKHVDTSNFNVLFEYKAKNIKGLQGKQVIINKQFKSGLDSINSYAERSNLYIIVNQAYRYGEPNKTIVRPVKNSNHYAGTAIDFNIVYKNKKYFSYDLKRENIKNLPIEIQNFISAVRENKVLRWGGDFNKQDPVHIDIPLNKNRKQWVLHSRICLEEYSKAKLKWDTHLIKIKK